MLLEDSDAASETTVASLAGILLRLAGAPVGYREAAVARGDDLEPCSVRAAFQIGNAVLRAVVGGIGIFGGVQHPQVFKAQALMHCLPGFRASAL